MLLASDEFLADVAAVYIGGQSNGAFGSGRLIAPGLILTARHVVDPASVTSARWKACLLRDRTARGSWAASASYGAEVIWRGSEDLDLALLKLVGREKLRPVIAPVFASYERVGAIDDVSAAGFPRACFPSTGKVWDYTARGVLRIAAQLGPYVWSVPPADKPDEPQGWKGMSGAGVCRVAPDGRLYLLGAIQEVAAGFSHGQLKVARLSWAFRDAEFRGHLRTALGMEPIIEAVELEPNPVAPGIQLSGLAAELAQEIKVPDQWPFISDNQPAPRSVSPLFEGQAKVGKPPEKLSQVCAAAEGTGKANPLTVEGRVKIVAPITKGDRKNWFLPGAGKEEWFQDADYSPIMVIVPAQKFVMGSVKTEPGHSSEEGPQHEVEITTIFAVSKYAITFKEWLFAQRDEQWSDFTELPPQIDIEDCDWGRGLRPVINISWLQAKAYVAWLSRKTGESYRLLSEAEWEYVARAGQYTPFWWGCSITTEQANYNGGCGAHAGEGTKSYRGRTVKVDLFDPNPWGLYQVHGNVWEWVEDHWSRNYVGVPTDGTAFTASHTILRVLRGGSWQHKAELLRSAARFRDSLDSKKNTYGLRVARDIGSPDEMPQ